MLETVLQIGKVFKNSPDGLKYHRYITSPSQLKNRDKITFLSLPVMEGFTFDFDSIKEIKDENIIRDKLFYFTFKTSDQDTAIKYIFGDIYFGKNKNGIEYGNYRIRKKAFDNGYKYLTGTDNESIKLFAASFKKEIGTINDILNKYESVYITFIYNDKFWYELTGVIEEINRILVNNFTEKCSHGLVFKKLLYRTLCSGDKKNDKQFPSFEDNNKYKSRYFTADDVTSLFYGIDYLDKPTIKPYNFYVSKSSEKINIVVLPRDNKDSPKLSAKDYENYSLTREEVIRLTREVKDGDWLLSSLLNEVDENILAFDVIFVKEGARTNTNILEISGIEISFLKTVDNRINKIRSNFEQKYGRYFFIVDSIKRIYDDKTMSLKKYQNHLFRILPQIYSATYYDDPYLISITIEKIEFIIRNQESEINTSINNMVNQIKHDFYFLITIQNTIIEGENLMKILESPSYKIGLLLGKIAIPLKDNIKSFEKNYVGNLTRRIASLDDLIKLKTFIEQKLIIHDKTYPNIKDASLKLAKEIKEFRGKYDRNECAFGFFESYFEFSKKENINPQTIVENKN